MIKFLTEDKQATIILELKPSEKELWEKLHKDARWGVGKAKREGLIVKETNDPKLLKKFYETYKKTCINGMIIPEEFNELFKDNRKTFIVMKEGKIIAGGVIEPYLGDKGMRLHVNGSLPEYQRHQPNNLLYWEIALWAKNKGYEEFDLGGYQLNAKGKLKNINKFKERWGGKLVVTKIKSKNPIYILGRKIIRNIHFIKDIRDWIKIKFWNLKNNL